MHFENSRSGALERLNKFLESDIINYNSKRNFDFGVNKRNNVLKEKTSEVVQKFPKIHKVKVISKIENIAKNSVIYNRR